MIFAIVVACAIFADVITGFVKAWSTKTLDSQVLRKGLLHKFSEIFLCGIAYGAEFATHYIPIDVSIPFFNATCGYIVLMEIISVFENLTVINPDLSKFIGKYLNCNKIRKEEKENEKFD